MARTNGRQASLGDNLRTRRKQLGLIMQDVAKATGLSVGFISQIERDIAEPSLSSLTAIAHVLGVEPGDFLGSAEAKARWDSLDWSFPDTSRVLTRDFPGSRLHAAMRRQEAGTQTDMTQPAAELLIMVLDGAITIHTGGEVHSLRQGESLHLHADQAYRMNNPGDQAAVILECRVAPASPRAVA